MVKLCVYPASEATRGNLGRRIPDGSFLSEKENFVLPLLDLRLRRGIRKFMAIIYARTSLARDDSSMSGQSGQRSSTTGQSASGKGGTSSGHKTNHKGHQKKQENSTSGQSGASGSSVPNAERTGVTGDTPSGGRSETSGQERGPSGY